MKSFAFAVAALAFTPIAANAGIYNTGTWRPYLTSDLGVTYTDATIHGYDMSGFTGVFNIGAGMRNDRARIGITYQKRDTISELFSSWITETNASLDEQAVMATVSYDIISAGWFGMYVGAGAGANFYDFKLEYKDARPDYTDSGTGFIGNLSAGIVLRISHLGITLGADYGYISRPHSTTITPRVGLNLNF